MSSFHLLLINGAVLTVCAVFDFGWRQQVLTALMLFLPLIDRTWSMPSLAGDRIRLARWGGLLSLIVLLNLITPGYAMLSITHVLLVALPEEWFFRGYFMMQLDRVIHSRGNRTRSPTGLRLAGSDLSANLYTSLLFALLHTLTQDWAGILVFFPSLLFGWVYQRTRDIVLVVLLHGLSNVVFFMYLKHFI